MTWTTWAVLGVAWAVLLGGLAEARIEKRRRTVAELDQQLDKTLMVGVLEMVESGLRSMADEVAKMRADFAPEIPATPAHQCALPANAPPYAQVRCPCSKAWRFYPARGQGDAAKPAGWEEIPV